MSRKTWRWKSVRGIAARPVSSRRVLRGCADSGRGFPAAVDRAGGRVAPTRSIGRETPPARPQTLRRGASSNSWSGLALPGTKATGWRSQRGAELNRRSSLDKKEGRSKTRRGEKNQDRINSLRPVWAYAPAGIEQDFCDCEMRLTGASDMDGFAVARRCEANNR